MATWSLEKSRGRSLLVVCPRCGELGRLYYSRAKGWHVKHGPRVTHTVRWGESVEVPLHEPRLGLGQYMGGDSFLLPFLAKMLHPHRVYVEVFGGLAPLLLNKPPSPIEVYNDVDGDLVNLFLVVRDNPRAFLHQLELLPYSRELYYRFLQDYRRERDPIRRAAMYWYVLRASFSGKFGRGFSTSTKTDPTSKYRHTLERIRLVSRRLRGVIVERLDFRELIKKYDGEHTMFYLDPPHRFYATEKGRDYYAAEFTDQDYADLLSLLERVRGKWLLKQNHDPALESWAREHGYTYKCVRVTSYVSRAMGAGRQKMQVCFTANYKIR